MASERLRTPHRAEEARRVPSQPFSLSHPAQQASRYARERVTWVDGATVNASWIAGKVRSGPILALSGEVLGDIPWGPRPGPCPGGPKKGKNLSRLGELLNTQKNVHFLPPGAPGGKKLSLIHI